MNNGIDYNDFISRICNTWDTEKIQKLYKEHNKSQDKPLNILYFIDNVKINYADKMWVLFNSKFIDENSARKLAYLYADRAVHQEKNKNPLVLKNLKALYNKIYNNNNNRNDIESLRIELFESITQGEISLSKKFYESSLAVYNAGREDFEKAATEASNSGRKILGGSVSEEEYEFQINLYKKITNL